MTMNNEILIYFPSDKLFDKEVNDLERGTYKKDLTDEIKLIRKYLVNYTFKFVDLDEDHEKDALVFRKIIEGCDQKKMVLAWFLELFYFDWRNTKSLIDVMPDKEKAVYKKLLESIFVQKDDVAAMLGVEIEDTKTTYFYYYPEKPLSKIKLPFVSFMQVGRNSWDYSHLYCYIANKAREVVSKALIHEKCKLKILDHLPEGIEGKSFELSALQLLPVIHAILDKYPLEVNASKFTIASVKNRAKMLEMEDFGLENNTRKEMAHLRASIMVQTLGLYQLYYDKGVYNGYNTTYPDLAIIEILNKTMDRPNQLIFILLYHIAGFRTSYVNNSDMYLASIIRCFFDALKKMPPGKWVETESFINNAFFYSFKVYYLLMMSSSVFYRMTLKNKFGVKEHDINKLDLVDHMGIPFVKALIFTMAAWGMIDVAFREVQKNDISPYDALLYMRINDFGAYALGLKENYTLPQNKDEKLFDLDPDRLIIRSLKENNPFSTLLADTCIPIGNGRYRADAPTLLSHCETKQDVEDKINFFKRYISGELPPTWSEFFENILQRCKPLEEQDAKDYHIFTISEKNKPLIQLIASDPILKQLVLRAQNHHLLVHRKNYERFEKRLISLGYLL